MLLIVTTSFSVDFNSDALITIWSPTFQSKLDSTLIDVESIYADSVKLV